MKAFEYIYLNGLNKEVREKVLHVHIKRLQKSETNEKQARIFLIKKSIDQPSSTPS